MENELSFELNKTAAWRDRQAERYSHDYRNAAAAKLLRKLAGEPIKNVEAGNRFSCMHEEVPPATYGEIISSNLADVGFRWLPSSADEVLARVLEQLEVAADETREKETKARERSVRRTLKANGLVLKKVPARSKQREFYGIGYMVVDAMTNIVALGAGAVPYSATLTEVEEFARA